MPAMALAPLASTEREIELRPCTSVTEYIMVISAGPTGGPTPPEATEERMSLGTPTGGERRAGAPSDAPPEPPAEMMPAILPWRCSQLAKASAIAVTEAPRSEPNTLDPPRPWLSAISCAETSQVASLPL